MKILLGVSLLAISAALLVACGGGGGGSSPTAAPPAPLPSAPTISVQPASVAVEDGQAATFNVSASGTAPLRYQWRRNGTVLINATAASYTTPPTQLVVDEGAQYDVIVSNSQGSATSALARLQVLPAAPQIDIGPMGMTVADGASVTFSVSARGTAPLQYQWLRDGVEIPGATANTYSFATTLSDNNSQFAVRVGNRAGNATSAPVRLGVNPLAPVIATQPLDVITPRATAAQFSILAAGTQPLSYQWQRSDDDGMTWQALSNATAPAYGLTNVQFADIDAQFRVRISNVGGEVTSQPAKLRVTGTLSVIAGAIGGTGNFDGPAPTARFDAPDDVHLDLAGNVLVADFSGGLRRISPAGVVSTLVAGSRHMVRGVTVNSSGVIFFADQYGVYKLDQNNNVVFIAGGPSVGAVDGTGGNARFMNPGGLAIDAAGNVIVADTENHAIRRVTPDGVVTTLAGALGQQGAIDAALATARFRSPRGVAVDGQGAIYVADTGNRAVRKIANGQVTTVAGIPGVDGVQDGAVNAALFAAPYGIAVNSAGTTIYVTDAYLPANILRRIQNGQVTLVAGQVGFAQGPYVDGQGGAARFVRIAGAALDGAGNVIVADSGGATVRRVTAAGSVTTVAGAPVRYGSDDGPGPMARFMQPLSLAGTSTHLMVADTTNALVRRVAPDGSVTTLAGLAGVRATVDGPSGSARFTQPAEIAVDVGGDTYVSEVDTHVIRRIASDGTVSTIAGAAGLPGSADGIGSAARFQFPGALVADGAVLYVSDTVNRTIRRIDLATRAVTTVAGASGVAGTADGPRNSARFSYVRAMAREPQGSLLVLDEFRLRRVAADGTVTTVAGVANSSGVVDGFGAAARFYSPLGVTVDQRGYAYISDGSTIRRVSPQGQVKTIVGQFEAFTVRPGANPLVNRPLGLWASPGGELFMISENAVLVYR